MKETNIKIFFDSSVIIDAITKRENSDNLSSVLFLKAVANEANIDGYLVSKQITDIYCVLRKRVPNNDIRKSFMSFLLKAFMILPLTKEDLEKALDINGSDYEDDVLIQIANNHNADYIVTNNIKDFKDSPIKALTPSQLLNQISK